MLVQHTAWYYPNTTTRYWSNIPLVTIPRPAPAKSGNTCRIQGEQLLPARPPAHPRRPLACPPASLSKTPGLRHCETLSFLFLLLWLFLVFLLLLQLQLLLARVGLPCKFPPSCCSCNLSLPTSPPSPPRALPAGGNQGVRAETFPAVSLEVWWWWDRGGGEQQTPPGAPWRAGTTTSRGASRSAGGPRICLGAHRAASRCVPVWDLSMEVCVLVGRPVFWAGLVVQWPSSSRTQRVLGQLWSSLAEGASCFGPVPTSEHRHVSEPCGRVWAGYFRFGVGFPAQWPCFRDASRS